jgi:hypothetical protein
VAIVAGGCRNGYVHAPDMGGRVTR